MRISFQSTLPAWGETYLEKAATGQEVISIHSPRMGRDYADMGRHKCSVYFNPLSPHGERHSGCLPLMIANIFQSTLPAWGETT